MRTGGSGATGPATRRPGPVVAWAGGETRSSSGEVNPRDDVVNQLDHLEEGGTPVLARVGNRVYDLAAHRAGVRAHDHDAVAEEHGFLDEMRNEEDRREPARPFREEAVDLGAEQLRSQHVEGREGLVHAEELGPPHERPRDPDALLHAAGKLLRIVALVAREADGGEHRLHALLRLARGQRATVQAHAHVVRDRQPRKEGEILEHDRGARVDARERLAVLFDGSRARRDQADEDAQQGGLPAARGPENGHDFVLAHFEIDVLEDDAIPPRLVGVDLVDANGGGDRGTVAGLGRALIG